MPSLPKPSAAKLKETREAAHSLLAKFPDYGKAAPGYANGITEFMASLSPKELQLVTDPRTGVVARCKFLPTIADFMEIIREYDAAQAKYAHIRDYSGLRPMTAAENEASRLRQIPRVHDRRGNWLSPSEARESIEQHQCTVASLKRANRLQSWIRHLGNGDSVLGWERAIELGQSEPPAGWQATGTELEVGK